MGSIDLDMRREVDRRAGQVEGGDVGRRGAADGAAASTERPAVIARQTAALAADTAAILAPCKRCFTPLFLEPGDLETKEGEEIHELKEI